MKLYNDYNTYLKTKYGCKVYKIGLDAGLSCPNRDGTKGIGGCVYCDDNASRASYTNPKDTISDQLAKRIKYLKQSRLATKFIAYFQAFTNTYASIDKLKKIYDEALDFDDVVGISIGTRPDAVDQDKLKLISSYKNRLEVRIEYGLQSIHDKTLIRINRGHSFADFLEALKLTKEFDIPVCAHVILGLPGETKADMIETAKSITGLKVNAVKIHLLHILKGSLLEELYNKGEVKVLRRDEYASLVCDFLEYLSPDIIIERLTGEGSRDSHVAPLWALDKTGTINEIGETLKKRGAFQGSKCG
ncbi:MAG: TIGR01212 family radical SAM protein [Candidatus Omnitrophota bacterium]|nr:TIGR01212 family radical SAM protein [Candidatus Omnitrophota bacterium]